MSQTIRTGLKKIFHSFNVKHMLLLGEVEHRQQFAELLLLYKLCGVVERAVAWEVRRLEWNSDVATKCSTDVNYFTSLGLHFLTYKELS